ncbi:type I-E CRISPR-associated protein Cas6/Cse3/CasE [Propioniciclava sinopodophylli]|uniref:type I-E CRISPR-associated protein Cas6/Cse3/CasE n=1 Tax=Propioniciclava sinopodophylli TaxID=1837344 RepID=UPI002493A9BE|nr:type I-E CRISPR-associated protein Cas6/Cse3/CasE [Propioniciclava sinopodophylli]
MILTRVYLNTRRQGAKKLLGSPQAMHAAILSGFAPGMDPGRPLWRVDSDAQLRPTLYILSRERPDLMHMEEQGGWPTQPTARSASYLPLLDSLDEGQTWSFRLRANPTHRATVHGKQRIVAHQTVAHQTEWLRGRASSLGVDLGSPEQPTFNLTSRAVLDFKRGAGRVTLGVAQFDGLLIVRDPEALRTALVGGIGRAKGYGCGLMTLVQPR